jgi:hypothetical protein
VSAPVRILLATCNGARHLQAQLQSYEVQDHTDWALWVSDDGSTDGTWQMLETFAAAHPDREVRLLRGPGHGAAANFLSLLTHPDLPPGPVTLSDQDDVWMPHRISRALAAVEAVSGPALYGSITVETDENLTPLPRPKKPLSPPSFENAMVQNIVAGNTATLNAAGLAALRTGGAPEVPYHDWWLYLRLSAVGAKVIIDDTPLLYYRQHPGAVIGAHRGPRAALARATTLLNGTYGQWVRTNLKALLAANDLPAPRAEAARILLTDPNRLHALHQSGARRSSTLGQSLLSFLALTGRL